MTKEHYSVDEKLTILLEALLTVNANVRDLQSKQAVLIEHTDDFIEKSKRNWLELAGVLKDLAEGQNETENGVRGCFQMLYEELMTEEWREENEKRNREHHLEHLKKSLAND